MQTEIDHFLKEQNDLLIQQNNLLAEQNNVLNQQVSSLKSILSKYSEVEQSLQNKISNLNTERETQQALILAMKSELSKLELGSFSEQLQQAFQNNVLMQLQTPLTRALNQLDLNSVVSDLVKTELNPILLNINTQQTDLKNALLKISQVKVPDNFYKDLKMQSKQIDMLVETVEKLVELINNLVD
eukprot:Unigene18898_Nuclearia_a/m.53873 Unigene18898_Nuclearia_a/g.53873  ORF Unigene18898_Nuclearia_a/g.53873 Unigene18898_Nuclearia_a/m.53873 type:complete len:186 (+) Unigene18898_Nuclearia_a:1958-2515(+)